MSVFVHVVTQNVVPIFVLILLGYAIGVRFSLDMNTLSKLNFYAYVPAFIFVSLYTTAIPLDMYKVVIAVFLLMFLNFLIGFAVGRLRGYDLALRASFGNSLMFYNSGNIGIPLITLVYSSAPFVIDGHTPYLDLALTAQVMVLVIQNVSTYTLGFFNAGRAQMRWQESLATILKMPTIYAIPAALLLKALPLDLTQTPLWPSLYYVRNGLISVALLTLGVQLSRTQIQLRSFDAYLAAMIRLLGGPFLAFFLAHAVQASGIMAQVLMISSAVPTAVNTVLIAVELDNRPDFASQTVLMSTLFSAVTMSAVIYLARILFPVG